MAVEEPRREPVELMRLGDGDDDGAGGNRVSVRVTGRFRPGVLPWHDTLTAEVVTACGFASGRLEVTLLPEDVDAWAAALEELAAGRDAGWLGERQPGLTVRHDPHGGPEDLDVEVVDAADTGTAVTVPVLAHEGWIDDHRERLARLRREFPREVVETSPGAYRWHPDRRR